MSLKYEPASEPLHQVWAQACREQIVYFSCLDLYDKSPDSGERQFKSRSWKQRFDIALRFCGLPSRFATGGGGESELREARQRGRGGSLPGGVRLRI